MRSSLSWDLASRTLVMWSGASFILSAVSRWSSSGIKTKINCVCAGRCDHQCNGTILEPSDFPEWLASVLGEFLSKLRNVQQVAAVPRVKTLRRISFQRFLLVVPFCHEEVFAWLCVPKSRLEGIRNLLRSAEGKAFFSFGDIETSAPSFWTWILPSYEPQLLTHAQSNA